MTLSSPSSASSFQSVSPKSSSPALKQTSWPLTINPSCLYMPISPYLVQQELHKQEFLKVFNNYTVPFSTIKTESSAPSAKRLKSEAVDKLSVPNWYSRFVEYKHLQSDSFNLANLYNSMYSKQSFSNTIHQKNSSNFARDCQNKSLNIGTNIVIVFLFLNYLNKN